jgi:hypothetical protein
MDLAHALLEDGIGAKSFIDLPNLRENREGLLAQALAAGLKRALARLCVSRAQESGPNRSREYAAGPRA